MDRIFYRIREFAAMAGISKSKAHELVAGGRVKAVRLDGMLLIPADELNAFAASLRGTTDRELTAGSPAASEVA